jgi:hypothetical protein
MSTAYSFLSGAKDQMILQMASDLPINSRSGSDLTVRQLGSNGLANGTGSGNGSPRSQSLGELPMKQLPVVQFSSAEYFCVEDEDILVIEVIRIGSMDSYSEVKYSTRGGYCTGGREI